MIYPVHPELVSSAIAASRARLLPSTSTPIVTGEFSLPTITGTSTSVSNDSQLTDALNASSPGDEIVLNGTFSASRTISQSGIVIRSTNALSGSVRGKWTVTGDDVYLYELDYSGNDRWPSIRGDDIRIYRCRFRDNNPPDDSRQRLIDVRGRRAHFGACEFTNCNSTAIYIRVIGGDNGFDCIIERCHFHTIQYGASGGALVACETDGTSLWVNGINGGALRFVNATVINCLFENIDVVGSTTNREMVMSKSNGNRFIGNTIINCRGFMNSRYTFNTRFEQNWIEDSFGLLTQGDGNIVLNNRLIDCERGLWAFGGSCNMDNIRQEKISTGKWLHPAVRNSVFAHNVTINTDFEVGRPNSSSVDTFKATNIDIENHTGPITYGSLADQPNIRVSSTSSYPQIAPVKLTAADVGRGYGV